MESKKGGVCLFRFPVFIKQNHHSQQAWIPELPFNDQVQTKACTASPAPAKHTQLPKPGRHQSRMDVERRAPPPLGGSHLLHFTSQPCCRKKSFSDYNLIEHRYGLSISEGAGTTQLCRGASLELVLTSSVYSWAQKDSGEGSKTPDLLREHIRRGCIVGQKILFFSPFFSFSFLYIDI